MPEHLRALIVILGLASAMFAYVQRPAFGLPIDPVDLRRRRNLWFVVTLTAFLSHNFWIYVIGVAAVLLVQRKHEPNPLAMYLMLLLAVPPFSAAIPGLGPIAQLFELNHLRLMSLAILLPAWWSLRSDRFRRAFGYCWADRFLLAYLLYQAALNLGAGNFTNGLRQGVLYGFTDVFLPYYVASRGLRNLAALSDAVASLALVCFVLSGIALFEFLKHWLLYAQLDSVLGVSFGMGNYQGRGDLAVIRANASLGHGIALGYVMAIASLLYLALAPLPGKFLPRWIGFGILMVGLLAALSRGPWVGMAVGISVLVLMSAHRSRDVSRLFVWGAIGFCLTLVSPYGGTLINLLPFIGTTDAGGVEYRQRLFEASLLVMKQNPWFGGGDYIGELAALGMAQGEGIVDLVNTYLAVALAQGLVGLGLFAAVFASAAVGLLSAWRRVGADSDLHRFGRALLAALAAALAIITTMSPILCVPTLYWLLAGLCVAYVRLAKEPPVDDLFGTQNLRSPLPRGQTVPV
jgi:hypothetical protein